MRRHSLLLVFVLAFSLVAAQLQAASLYMDPAFSSLERGDALTVSVRLDTNEAEDECVNAVDAVITYSDNIVPVDTSTGDSIFSMWVEQPKIDTEKRTITFAGGIPNGYCGRVQGDPRLTNTLAKLIFRSPGFVVGQNNPGTTTAKIEFAPESSAYLNDGLGTKADLALFGASVDLSQKPATAIDDAWREAVGDDEIPPEPFSIIVHKDDYAFSGKYFISFNTSDKQTGIDQYQVMEEPLTKFWSFEWGRADAPWVTTRSPYVLEDQSLNSTIRVKAIDKAGNEYIATLIPEEGMRTLGLSSIIVIAGLALVGLLVIAITIVGVRSWYKKRKARLAQDTDVSESTNEEEFNHTIS